PRHATWHFCNPVDPGSPPPESEPVTGGLSSCRTLIIDPTRAESSRFAQCLTSMSYFLRVRDEFRRRFSAPAKSWARGAFHATDMGAHGVGEPGRSVGLRGQL